MIVVSFYTNDVYMRYAAGLKKSCESFGMPCEIDQLADLGGWQKNVLQKPAFVRRKMEAHPGEDILWLDADCIVRSMPELLAGLSCDVAAYSARYPGDVWGSTVLFKATDLAKEVVSNWEARVKQKPDWQDNLSLKFAIAIDTPAATLVPLPLSYTWTEWLMRSWDMKAKAVIEHLGVESKRRTEQRAGGKG